MQARRSSVQSERENGTKHTEHFKNVCNNFSHFMQHLTEACNSLLPHPAPTRFLFSTEINARFPTLICRALISFVNLMWVINLFY